MLARAGYSVVVLEQGADWAEALPEGEKQFDQVFHDEYRFGLEKPLPVRRPRGDYSTFRKDDKSVAKPFEGGWTATDMGGGSLLWGCWGIRPLPVDLRLQSLFKELGQSDKISEWGYSVADWPISYNELEPVLNIAEAILSVGGDHQGINKSIKESPWFKAFSAETSMNTWRNTLPSTPFPSKEYPQRPIGSFFFKAMNAIGMNPTMIPSAMVNPDIKEYCTQDMIDKIIKNWGDNPKPEFWNQSPKEIWSDTVRDACNICGFCGEYVCWGSRQPKYGTLSTTLHELRNLREVAEIRPDSKV
ncbi:hypothetical protein IK7_05612 [Bacillus cereus VD156]|uniref:hypothetical protein n=1 Tax=Bacillus cereus TaxID=1396 RepID=UPI000279BABE|nr:hypothetical protein [Bacillus cereus]EJR74386.1 hypothetical protein IK7_05612 [Bacillus cereus VD156]